MVEKQGPMAFTLGNFGTNLGLKLRYKIKGNLLVTLGSLGGDLGVA